MVKTSMGKILFVTVIASLIGLPLFAQAQDKPLKKVNWGVTSLSASNWIPWIAKEAKIYEKNGLDVAATRVVELGESPATVDLVATEGVKIPQAPLKEIDSLGATVILRELSKLRNEMPGVPLTPPQLITAMAREGQTFYKNNQPSPWLNSLVKSPTAHASY